MNERTRLLINKNPNRVQIINKNEEDESVKNITNTKNYKKFCKHFFSPIFLKGLLWLQVQHFNEMLLLLPYSHISGHIDTFVSLEARMETLFNLAEM